MALEHLEKLFHIGEYKDSLLAPGLTGELPESNCSKQKRNTENGGLELDLYLYEQIHTYMYNTTV